MRRVALRQPRVITACRRLPGRNPIPWDLPAAKVQQVSVLLDSSNFRKPKGTTALHETIDCLPCGRDVRSCRRRNLFQ